MKITEISIKRSVGTYLVIFSVFVLGFFSLPNIPVSFWPEFVAPTLIVMAPYPGVGPEEIEEQIAEPLEEELATIDGVDEIETACLEGMCRVFVRFGWGVDFDEAKRDVQERTRKARSQFPRDAAEPLVLQVQDFLPPGIELGFYSEQRDLNEIRDIVDTKLKNRFVRLEDVATVSTFGGFEQHVNIEIDPDRLYAFGISMTQVNNALTAENLNMPAGKLTTGYKNYYLRIIGKFRELRDIENVIITSLNNSPVYLKDVATVTFRNKERDSIIRLNGREIVGLQIREKSGGNTVAMVEEVRAELGDVRDILPDDIKLVILRDQSIFIKNSINNVITNAGIGALLAALIILLFLGNIRNTLIIALSIPISIVATFLLIDMYGLSINTISLGGLALGVGMIVDSSIVVLENIFRHLREKKEGDRLTRIVDAASEVGSAITASTLTSVVVFLPLAFLVGLFAVLLGELALTVVFALSISIVVALTVVPMLSYKLMKPGTSDSVIGRFANGWQKLFDKILDTYKPTLRWALRHRLLTLFIALVLLIVTIVVIVPLLDVEMLPAINEGEFRLELQLPESSQLELSDAMSQKIETDIARFQEVEQVYAVVGILSVRGELKPNTATVTVKLKPEFYDQINAVMARVRDQWSSLPGTKVAVRQTDVTEGMRREPVNVRISGDDLTVLTNLGQQALDKVQAIPGVVNTNSSLLEGLAEFGIEIDREKASDLGLTFPQIATAVRMAVLGASNTRFSSYGKEYDITVEVDASKIESINDLMNLPLTTMRGQVIPLKTVATIDLRRGPSEIKRFDQQRVVEIKGDVSGRAQREVVAEVKNTMQDMNLPPNYYLTFGGQSKGIADSFRSLLVALTIAIFLVYVVMGAQFNSFLHPFTIAMTIPLALIGVFFGLWIFGAALSMNALLGMIMLVGIVVNNGILLIDYINQLRNRGMEKYEAIVTGGTTRLRPILITALTTIFGMLPIAFGFGEGGEALQPLGAVVVGGLTTSTFLTLIIIPVVYSLIDRLSKNRSE